MNMDYEITSMGRLSDLVIELLDEGERGRDIIETVKDTISDWKADHAPE